MSPTRFSICLVFSVGLSTSTYAAIGLGPYCGGIVPCDSVCIGGAMASGDASLTAQYAAYTAQVNAMSTSILACDVAFKEHTLATQANLTQSGVALTTLDTLNTFRQVSAIDSISIKIGEALSTYSAAMAQIFLEFSNSITARLQQFELMMSLQFRDETPSKLASILVENYLEGINTINKRYEERLKSDLEIAIEKTSIIEAGYSSGQGARASRFLRELSVKETENIFDKEAEFFNPPAFVPGTLNLYRTADLQMASSLARKESNCLSWQSVTDSSYFSCGPQDFQVEGLLESMMSAIDKQQKIFDESFKEVSDEAHKPSDEPKSSQCLSGLLGLNVELALISPENGSKLALLKTIKDYLMKTGCAMLTEFLNENIKLLNSSINKIGSDVEEKTLGFASLGSEKSKDSTWGAKSTVQPILESDMAKDFSEDTTKKINNRFFGEDDPFDGANDIDFTDQRHLKVEEGEKPKPGTQNKTNRIDLEKKINESICGFFDCPKDD